MAADPKARKFSLTWEGGYLTTTRGLLEEIWGTDFLKTAGAGVPKVVAVKGHTRTRVIGGGSKAVGAYSYNTMEYPRKVKGGAAGGQAILINSSGSWWTARLGGSVQEFKAFLKGKGAPTTPFTFTTQRGGEYSSAS